MYCVLQRVMFQKLNYVQIILHKSMAKRIKFESADFLQKCKIVSRNQFVYVEKNSFKFAYKLVSYGKFLIYKTFVCFFLLPSPFKF